MTYIIGQKFLGPHFVRDEYGNDLFYLKPAFPFINTFSFVTTNGKEVFKIKKKFFNFFRPEKYSLEKDGTVYARIIRERFGKSFYQTIKAATHKELKFFLAHIQKQDGSSINVTLQVKFKEKPFFEFIQDDVVIARATDIQTFKSITTHYAVELAENLDKTLFLASIIIIEIMCKNSVRNSNR